MKKTSESLAVYHSSQTMDNSPLKEDKDLNKMLASIELNQNIPLKFYSAAAQLLTFIYFLEDKISEKNDS